MKLRSNVYEKFCGRSSCVGVREVNNYCLRTSPDGMKFLESVGVRDLHEEVQQFKDSCDIYKLMHQYTALTGIVPGKSKVVIGDVVDDVSSIPTDIFAMKNCINNAKIIYNRLPADIRADFTAEQFVNQINTDLSAFNKYFVKKDVENPKSPESEVVNNA